MAELFDMGKYDFFVWSSIGIFIVALLFDYFSATNQNSKIKKQIKAQLKRKQAQKNQTRSEST